jgi:H+/Na+-translocating ferredoxin:NAD+ oxidoreductase subunit E
MSAITQEFTKGLWKEIPPFRFVLGLCPTLAVTTSMENGIGMGLAATFVLVCANGIISLLRKVIPDEVRVACYVVIIATFVVCVEMFTKAYVYSLYESLGIFIPLIVVNCIILGRAEAFAKKNPVLPSLADGLGMGLGFTLSLAALGGIRELFGAGSILGFELFKELGIPFQPFDFLQQAPGAFICLGLMLGIMNVIGNLTSK